MVWLKGVISSLTTSPEPPSGVLDTKPPSCKFSWGEDSTDREDHLARCSHPSAHGSP